MSLTGITARDTANKGALNSLIQWLGEAKKILVVAAAGNNGSNTAIGDKMYYAGSFSQPNLINVAALSPTGDSLWAGSNYGPTIDIAAPGVNIPCLQPFSNIPLFKSGTSNSTAYVTAAAAILAGYRTTQTFEYATIKAAIINGAMKPLVGSHNVATRGWLNTCGALAYFRTHQIIGQGFISNPTNNNLTTLNTHLQVYPNPFDTSMNAIFTLDVPKKVEISAFNLMGQQVWAQSVNGTAGVNRVSCQMNEITKGMLTVVVKTDDKQWIHKVVKN